MPCPPGDHAVVEREVGPGDQHEQNGDPLDGGGERANRRRSGRKTAGCQGGHGVVHRLERRHAQDEIDKEQHRREQGVHAPQ